MQQFQQLALLVGGQAGQVPGVPVIKHPVADRKGRPALFGQFQMVAAAALFFGEESILGQLGEAALGVAPVQMQSLLFNNTLP